MQMLLLLLVMLVIHAQLTYNINLEPIRPNNSHVIKTKLQKWLNHCLIDGIAQGHRHVMAHHYYDHIPYMGSIDRGYYLNVLYLTFNQKK